MGALLAFNQNLETITCWAREGCGIVFAMPAKFMDVCREQGTCFYCPRGHTLRFGKSDVDRLQEQLDEANAATQRERKKKEWAQEKTRTVERSRNAYKGKVTAIKNRVGHGVCPCCKRTFQQLARHMRAKHPNFATEGA